MKKLLLAIFLFASCSKDEETPQTEIKVVESVSNIPVSGAKLAFLRCNYGCPGGGTLVFEGITDADGTCKVPSSVYDDANLTMNVYKTRYWEFEVQRSTVVSIAPEGWVKLRTHKVGNYPPGSILLLSIRNQSGSRSELSETDATGDLLVTIRGFGSQTNSVHWQVVDPSFSLLSSGTLEGLNIPRFDTLHNVTLDY